MPNFPTALDDNTSLHQVVDNTTALIAAHHNELKDAVIALEQKVGIYNSSVPTAIDVRLGHPTLGHTHDGASGQGLPIPASAIQLPTTAFPANGNLLDHVNDAGLHGGGDPILRRLLTWQKPGTAIVGSNTAPPLVMPRTAQFESISGVLRRGPSGATAAFKILVGPTDIYGASVGLGMRFAPGASVYRSATLPNLVTVPSGAVLTLDVTNVGSSEPGQDLGITFIFRD